MKGSLCKIFSDKSLGHEAMLGYQVHSLSSSITSHFKAKLKLYKLNGERLLPSLNTNYFNRGL